MSGALPIQGDDLWAKVVEMLQQNWAAIERDAGGVSVFFISDTSEVFDQLSFDDATDAASALARNGFRRFRAAPDLQRFLRAPRPPFKVGNHPNGPIYSSGRFWTS
jgi:hypothetical protein